MDTAGLTWPVQRTDNFLRIVVYIALATALIFVIDIITPLGVMAWILYLIPLFLTVYLSWKYAPVVLTGIFILLMTITLFLNLRDMSLEYAILDRVFFAVILIIASFFIRDYVSNVEGLARSEERYRHLVDRLPEGIVVYQKDRIAYVNPAGARILGTEPGEDLIGHDIINMIDPEFKAVFQERITQAALGALMNIDSVRLIRSDGSSVKVGMSLGSVFWDKEAAAQIVMRNL